MFVAGHIVAAAGEVSDDVEGERGDEIHREPPAEVVEGLGRGRSGRREAAREVRAAKSRAEAARRGGYFGWIASRAHHFARPHLHLARVEDVAREEVEAQIEDEARVDKDIHVSLLVSQDGLEGCRRTGDQAERGGSPWVASVVRSGDDGRLHFLRPGAAAPWQIEERTCVMRLLAAAPALKGTTVATYSWSGTQGWE